MLKLKLLATAILVSVVSTAVSGQNAPGIIQPPRAHSYQVPPPKASAPVATSFWIKKEEFPPIFKLFSDTLDDESLVEVEAKVLEFMKESACKNNMVAIKVTDAQTRREIIEEKPCVDFFIGRYRSE